MAKHPDVDVQNLSRINARLVDKVHALWSLLLLIIVLINILLLFFLIWHSLYHFLEFSVEN